MRILEQRTYVGPNLYATFPVIRLTLDLGPLEEAALGDDPRLRRAAPHAGPQPRRARLLLW
jgi:hypothetical protein